MTVERGQPTRRPAKPRPRWIRVVGWSLLVLFHGVMFVTLDAWQALGTGAVGDRLARMERSPQYGDGQFVNETPPQDFMWESTTKWLTGGGDHREPRVPVPVVKRRAADFAELLRPRGVGLERDPVGRLGHGRPGPSCLLQRRQRHV